MYVCMYIHTRVGMTEPNSHGLVPPHPATPVQVANIITVTSPTRLGMIHPRQEPPLYPFTLLMRPGWDTCGPGGVAYIP